MQAGLRTIMCKFGIFPAICLREEAILVKSQKCPYHVTFDLDLDIEHILDAGSSGDHHVQHCKFGGDPAICLREEAIFVKSQKCPCHVTFDLDLEHTLDTRSSGDHRVQVWWRSSHFCGRRSDLRKVYRRTDRQTDRRTTDAARLH